MPASVFVAGFVGGVSQTKPALQAKADVERTRRLTRSQRYPARRGNRRRRADAVQPSLPQAHRGDQADSPEGCVALGS